MIIPIRCFNCGQVLASKYRKYKQLLNSPELVLINKHDDFFFVSTESLKMKGDTLNKSDVVTLDNRKEKIDNLLKKIKEYHQKTDNVDMTNVDTMDEMEEMLPTKGANNIEALLLKQIGVKRYCCKSNLIGHIDILDI